MITKDKRLVRAYLLAREKIQKHNLVGLAELNPEEDGLELSKEYRERFVDPRDEFGSFGLERYAQALEHAIAESISFP